MGSSDESAAAPTIEKHSVGAETASSLAHLTLGLVIAYLVVSRLVADIYTLPVGMSLHVTDVILAALLSAWLLWRLTEPLPFPMGAAAALGSALIVVFLITPYVNATNLSAFEIGGAERGLVRATLYTGLFIASYHLALTRGRAVRILGVVVAVTVSQALVAVYEVATKNPLLILGSMWQSIGMEVDPRAIRSAETVLKQRLTGEFRVSATSAHPLVLVGLLAVGLGIAVAFYIYSDSRRNRIVLLGAVVAQLFAIGATNQRTGVVALAAVAVVIVLTQVDRLPSMIPLSAAVAAGGVTVALFSRSTARLILNFVTGVQTDQNVDVRLSKYSALPELLERRPFIGAGYLTHDPLLLTFDNGYLTTLVELGIIGFAILIGFLLVVGGRMFAALGRAQLSDRPILLSAVVAVTVLMASMSTFDALSFTQLFPTVLIVIAVGLARADQLRLKSRVETRSHRHSAS